MTTPRKASTKAAVQAANPLADLGDNLGGPVPSEFRMPVPGETRESYEAAQNPQPAKAADPEQKTQISDSGRAPKVAGKDRVWIILDDNDEIPPGGQFIGVNGVGYNLLPGVEAFVPKAVLEVLDHAIKSVPVTDPMTKRIVGWKNRKRFPYTIVQKRERETESA